MCTTELWDKEELAYGSQYCANCCRQRNPGHHFEESIESLRARLQQAEAVQAAIKLAPEEAEAAQSAITPVPEERETVDTPGGDAESNKKFYNTHSRLACVHVRVWMGVGACASASVRERNYTHNYGA
jgi:hypothetical protein